MFDLLIVVYCFGIAFCLTAYLFHKVCSRIDQEQLDKAMKGQNNA